MTDARPEAPRLTPETEAAVRRHVNEFRGGRHADQFAALLAEVDALSAALASQARVLAGLRQWLTQQKQDAVKDARDRSMPTNVRESAREHLYFAQAVEAEWDRLVAREGQGQ